MALHVVEGYTVKKQRTRSTPFPVGLTRPQAAIGFTHPVAVLNSRAPGGGFPAPLWLRVRRYALWLYPSHPWSDRAQRPLARPLLTGAISQRTERLDRPPLNFTYAY